MNRIPIWVSVLLSFICLVPILGGIVGLIVLLLGIIRYKNKYLIIIGSIGIVVTIFMVSYLKYYSTRRGPFDKSRELVAKDRLKDILRELELYKLSFGKYPSDLNELMKSNRGLMINDPIQTVHPEMSDHYFYYKKADSGYYLFSKGFDGIPFTQDDIMPSFSGINLNKLGIKIDSISLKSN